MLHHQSNWLLVFAAAQPSWYGNHAVPSSGGADNLRLESVWDRLWTAVCGASCRTCTAAILQADSQVCTTRSNNPCSWDQSTNPRRAVGTSPVRVLFDLPYKLRLQCTMPEQVSTLSNAITLPAVIVPPPFSCCLMIGCSQLLSIESTISGCTVTLVQQAQVAPLVG